MKVIQNRQKKVEELEKKLLSFKNVIKANELSKEKQPTATRETGFFRLSTMAQRLQIMPLGIRAMKGQIKALKTVKDNPIHYKKRASQEFLNSMEKWVKSLGADQIGYTKISEDLIFKGKGILFENAIVLTRSMDKDKFADAPNYAAFKNVMNTYIALGDIVNSIAKDLRKEGYGVMAAPAFGGVVDYNRLGEAAGLGVVGYNGLLITSLGPLVRIAAIYTSIENLPFAKTNEHTWIKDFCSKCGKCFRCCPVQAIYREPMLNSKGQETYIDAKICRPQYVQNFGCGICMKECVFNKRGYDKVKTRFAKS